MSATINACILASSRREAVAMRHVVEAVARNDQMGKQVCRHSSEDITSLSRNTMTAIHFCAWIY